MAIEAKILNWKQEDDGYLWYAIDNHMALPPLNSIQIITLDGVESKRRVKEVIKSTFNDYDVWKIVLEPIREN